MWKDTEPKVHVWSEGQGGTEGKRHGGARRRAAGLFGLAFGLKTRRSPWRAGRKQRLGHDLGNKKEGHRAGAKNPAGEWNNDVWNGNSSNSDGRNGDNRNRDDGNDNSRINDSSSDERNDDNGNGDNRNCGDGISTGLRFLDHMLAQIAHHGGVALEVEARGDLDIDEHHTMEDVAIVLGKAIDWALGSKAGIGRYGFALPMDDCRALVLLDFGGRIDFEWDAEFRRERVGDVPTEMFRHFFHSLCCAARCNLQIAAKGDNDHHKAEAIFKAFARALRMAVARSGFGYDIPSSKGVL